MTLRVPIALKRSLVNAAADESRNQGRNVTPQEIILAVLAEHFGGDHG
jgi:hypothetical protein